VRPPEALLYRGGAESRSGSSDDCFEAFLRFLVVFFILLR
jgi:hypothetical protein